jgi:hypothetical protein
VVRAAQLQALLSRSTRNEPKGSASVLARATRALDPHAERPQEGDGPDSSAAILRQVAGGGSMGQSINTLRANHPELAALEGAASDLVAAPGSCGCESCRGSHSSDAPGARRPSGVGPLNDLRAAQWLLDDAAAEVGCRDRDFVWNYSMGFVPSDCMAPAIEFHEKKHIADLKADPKYKDYCKTHGGGPLTFENCEDRKRFETSAINAEIDFINKQLPTAPEKCKKELTEARDETLPKYQKDVNDCKKAGSSGFC